MLCRWIAAIRFEHPSTVLVACRWLLDLSAKLSMSALTHSAIRLVHRAPAGAWGTPASRAASGVPMARQLRGPIACRVSRASRRAFDDLSRPRLRLLSGGPQLLLRLRVLGQRLGCFERGCGPRRHRRADCFDEFAGLDHARPSRCVVLRASSCPSALLTYRAPYRDVGRLAHQLGSAVSPASALTGTYCDHRLAL